MKSLLRECPECDGCGYVTVDINDTHIPYERNEIDYTCMSCDGKGYVIIPDELNERIDEVQYMIEGMQTRIQMLSDWIKGANKYNNKYLVSRYINRLESCSRGLVRLKYYKQKLRNLA